MLRIDCTQREGVSYPLLVDKIYSVGRKQGDITFPDDQSISRLHAELKVIHSMGNISDPLLVPMLKLTDSGSKFGSFATENSIKEKIQVPARESATLPINEIFRFGLQWNEFRVHYTPLVVTTSSMKTSTELKEKIVRLGGHMLNEWSSHVTHVLMESVSLTVKVVCALLSAKPIVNPCYITDLLSCFENGRATNLEIGRYLPPVTEKAISELKTDSFQPNGKRTTLFGGKTFLFCTNKHLKRLSAAIEAGGGTAQLISDEVTGILSKPEGIVMGSPTEIAIGEKDPKIKRLLSLYKRSGKRFIGDSEIGLAAVHISIEKFCNPKFNMANAVIPSSLATTQHSQSSTASSVPLVGATQDINTQRSSIGSNTSKNIVNESTINDESEDEVQISEPTPSRALKRNMMETAGTSSAKKRVADDEPLFKPPSKRVKDVETTTTKPSSSRSLRSDKTSRSPVKNPSRALSSLFNMSDSDDDDAVGSKTGSQIVVPESQPKHGDSSIDENEPQVIPDSQDQDEGTGAAVNVVDVRKLQSKSQQGSETASFGFSGRNRERDMEDEAVRIVESPPLETIDETPAERGTDFIDTIRTSVTIAETIAVPKSPQKAMSKPVGDRRKTGSTTEEPVASTSNGVGGGSTKKRPRDEDDNILKRTKKITLSDIKEDIREVESNGPSITRPLINKNLMRNRYFDVSLESNDSGRSTKNFKTFKKVLPRFMAKGRAGSGQENLSGRTRADILNESIESTRSSNKIKLVRKDYDPGATRVYGLEVDSLPALGSKRDTREKEVDTPPEILDMDDMMETPAPKRQARNGKANNNDQPIASTSTRSRARAVNSSPTTSPSKERSQPQRRRASPRKKGSSQDSASLMPPPAQPRSKFVPMEEENEEEEDDWTFSR